MPRHFTTRRYVAFVGAPRALGAAPRASNAPNDSKSELIMQENEKFAAAQKLHEKARQLRDEFLNLVAVIERRMGIILTRYYCVDDDRKRELFFESIIEKFTAQRKRDLIIEILKRDHSCYWEENKQTLNELEFIQAFRNKLAHSVLGVSDEALARPLKEGIGFIQWKKGAPVTDAEFGELRVAANMVLGCLSDIERLLPFVEISKK